MPRSAAADGEHGRQQFRRQREVVVKRIRTVLVVLLVVTWGFLAVLLRYNTLSVYGQLVAVTEIR